MNSSVKKSLIVSFCLSLALTLASTCLAQDQEGCSPGYWKQEQHFKFWEGALPTDTFAGVFGRDITIRLKKKDGGGTIDNPTLLEALNAPGGGLNALARQTVAAFLNAENLEVDYEYTSGAVILMFQAAFDDGSKSVIDTQKDDFETRNELGCPFDSLETEE